jgi:predicted enzyme related to lactoylglutathione lyase
MPDPDTRPPSSGMARLVVTILAVDDVERAARFYRQAFGWPIRVDVPVLVEFALPGGGGLSVYKRSGFARNTGLPPQPKPAGATTATELYFHVEDLDAAEERLTAAGARLLSPRAPRDWGDEATYYADPEGNVVVVARPAR